MNHDQFFEKLPDNYSSLDLELIEKAYRYAEEVHKDTTLASGLPYISHCASVAAILAELSVPPDLIITGLLHDILLKDKGITIEDIQKEFSSEIANLVDGVTKLTNLPNLLRGNERWDKTKKRETTPHRKDREDEIAEALRKTFLAMSDDIRVVIVKLADRLNNMRTLSYFDEETQKRIAQETLDIFAPLANRLGIWQIKWELQDLAFRYSDPEKYKNIAEKLANRRADRENQIQEIINRLDGELRSEGVKAKLSGRPKHIYSIFQKMKRKDLPFEMLMDLRGVRLIVKDIASCYKALGVVHMKWRPIPGEFDDYIAARKENNYQSLHTAIVFDDGKPLEIQIRTEEMHENAEYGIAAHWRYKEDSSKIKESYQQKISWLRSLFVWQQEEDAGDLVDSWKSDVFKDRVYILTPQGDIIDLPAGSTPIDFAYHVHTEIGHRCRGSKINGKLVSLDHVLETGNQVEILTAKRGGPSRDWLNPNLGLIQTSRARAKIKQWFKRQDRESNLAQGKSLLEKEFKRLGLKNIVLEDIISEFGMKSVEDLFVAIGCGDIGVGRVVNKLAELEEEELTDEIELDLVEKPESIMPSDTVKVMGLKGIATTIARCCNPMPGDEIIGYITRGRGATIHRQDCPNILSISEKERLVKVSWGQPGKAFTVPVQIKAYDRQGLMADISNILSEESVNLIDMSMKMNQHIAVIKLVLGVKGISQLSRILTRLESLANVFEANRRRPG